jgi:hypothetical protein
MGMIAHDPARRRLTLIIAAIANPLNTSMINPLRYCMDAFIFPIHLATGVARRVCSVQALWPSLGLHTVDCRFWPSLAAD